ncbi:hypothetical protein PDQ34_21020 [Bacillus cereus]|nr:hypothetical protein [Bacillus cereus]MDA2571546.1 hypothetical protein [Bacillus cereus]
MLQSLAILFLLLTFVSLGMLIVGLFKPDKVLRKSTVKTRGRVVKIYLLTAITSFIICNIFVLSTNSGSKSDNKETSNREAQEETKIDNKKAVAPATKEQYDKLQEKRKKEDFEEKIKKAVTDTLGKKNLLKSEINTNAASENSNDKIVLLTVKPTVNDKLIMLENASKILEKISKIENISEVVIFMNTTLVDQYGRESDDNVMKIIFNRETLKKINFKNLVWDNIPEIADEYWQAPAVK